LSALATARARSLYRAAAALLLPCAFACNQRFEFDVGSAGSSGGGAGGTNAAAGSVTGGAGAGAISGGAGSGGVGASSTCGSLTGCPGGLHCLDGACLDCVVDADCSTARLSRCDPERHRCVACLAASDCALGFTCDELANRCLRVCAEEEACPATAHGCDERRGVCYQCDEDRECSASPLGPYCAADGSGCVACRGDADCAEQHCDQLTGRCVDCRDGRDCPSSLCEPTTRTCLP
jgi:hypothetical protein